MGEEKLRLKKGDYFILLIIFFVIIILLIVLLNMKQGNQVHVTVNGTKTTYSLFSDDRIIIDNKNNDADESSAENIIVIENGYVFMEYANCPDQICVNHKSIHKNGEMIVCLPNQIFVEIDN